MALPSTLTQADLAGNIPGEGISESYLRAGDATRDAQCQHYKEAASGHRPGTCGETLRSNSLDHPQQDDQRS